LNGNWEKYESINWKEYKEFVLSEIDRKKKIGGFLIIEGC
jgi:hypothetical protein